MTRAQRKWLKVLHETGFVEHGGWGRGQRNRPLFALVAAGHAVFDIGPKGSFLKVQGFMPSDNVTPIKPPQSETLSSVVSFLNY